MSNPIRLFGGLMALALSLACLPSVSNAKIDAAMPFHNVQSQADDEQILRNLAETYFMRYAAQDLDGLISLWSAQAPDYASLKQNLQRQFAVEAFRFSQPIISRIKLEREQASLRVTAKQATTDLKSKQQREQQIMRNIAWVREAGQWKVWRYATAENELAEQLATIVNEAEQIKLLAAEPELATSTLVNALNTQGTQLRDQRKMPQALAAHRAARDLAERISDRTGLAVALNGLGNDYHLQGDYAQATQFLLQSLEILEALQDKSRIAAAWGNLGNVYHAQSNYAQARESFEKTLKLSVELGDKSRSATALLSLGNVNRAQGDYTQALQFYRQAIQIVEELGNTIRISGMLNNLGLVYQEQGNYAQALAAYQRGLALDEASNDKINLAMKLHNIGSVHRAQGNQAQALAYYEKSLALNEELGERYRIAGTLLALGDVHWQLGHLAQATMFYQKSLALREALGDKAGIAGSLNSIGRTYYAQGDYASALEHHQKSLALREAIGDRKGIAASLIDLSNLYVQQARYEQAHETASRAADLSRQMGDAENHWLACFTLGVAARALNKPAQARQAWAESLAEIETMRANVAGGGEDRQRFFASKMAPYHALVDLLIREGQAAEALRFAERAKARVLLDVLQSGSANITTAMTEPEREQERKFNSQLASLNTQFSRETARSQPNQGRLTELKSQLEKARLDFEAYQTSLYALHPELQLQRGKAEPLTLAQADALLPDNATALLEYVVTDDAAFLFVVTQTSGLKVYPLQINSTELTKEIETFRQQLAARELGFRATATKLYDLLLKPAQAQLKGKTKLVIVPDGKLWELPFQALPTSANHYLIEDAAISYAPSLTVLREMMKRKNKSSSAPTLLALGNPALGKETIERATFALRDGKFDPLPEAESEVKALGQLYGAANSKVFTGAEAREDRAKAEAGQMRVLHFATHGVLNNAAPLYSHLVLAQNEKDDNKEANKEDGLLEAWELMQMDLHADLAVLSACETARGKFGAGEGVIGLSWALFVAGVPSTVVSQWKVESAATRDLMIGFHRNLRSANTTKAAALRQAALSVMKRPATSHPFYWAGFVLIGDGR